MIVESQCIFCKHYHNQRHPDTKQIICDAYSDGVPRELLYNSVIHRKPFEGDNGIQFELKSDIPEGVKIPLELM